MEQHPLPARTSLALTCGALSRSKKSVLKSLSSCTDFFWIPTVPTQAHQRLSRFAMVRFALSLLALSIFVVQCGAQTRLTCHVANGPADSACSRVSCGCPDKSTGGTPIKKVALPADGAAGGSCYRCAFSCHVRQNEQDSACSTDMACWCAPPLSRQTWGLEAGGGSCYSCTPHCYMQRHVFDTECAIEPSCTCPASYTKQTVDRTGPEGGSCYRCVAQASSALPPPPSPPTKPPATPPASQPATQQPTHAPPMPTVPTARNTREQTTSILLARTIFTTKNAGSVPAATTQVSPPPPPPATPPRGEPAVADLAPSPNPSGIAGPPLHAYVPTSPSSATNEIGGGATAASPQPASQSDATRARAVAATAPGESSARGTAIGTDAGGSDGRDTGRGGSTGNATADSSTEDGGGVGGWGCHRDHRFYGLSANRTGRGLSVLSPPWQPRCTTWKRGRRRWPRPRATARARPARPQATRRRGKRGV